MGTHYGEKHLGLFAGYCQFAACNDNRFPRDATNSHASMQGAECRRTRIGSDETSKPELPWGIILAARNGLAGLSVAVWRLDTF